jgi:uncharacterized protein YpmS
LKVPRVSRSPWRMIRIVLLALLVPIALFFVILFMLTRR